MNKFYTLILILVGCMTACLPGTYEYEDPGFADMNKVVKMKVRASHSMLLPDGKAQIVLTTLLTTDEGYDLIDDRTDFSQLEYYNADSGEKMTNTYSTSDKSMIGKKIGVYAKLKGRDLLSDTVSFVIISPAAQDEWEEISIPVVFHILQTEDDVLKYGGAFPQETVYRIFNKLNDAFSGVVSQNPTGVDSKIRFKLALYNPFGAKLGEQGINRQAIDSVGVRANDDFKTFIQSKGLQWDANRYLNIWLISDRQTEVLNFYRNITTFCKPYYKNPNIIGEQPKGLSIKVAPRADSILEPNTVGIIYRLQSLLLKNFTFGTVQEAELTTALGIYLGLIPTYTDSTPREDYCSDTQAYSSNVALRGYKGNSTIYKLTDDNNYFFLSENIMEGQTGGHRSVTQEQVSRIRWVLMNCPGRFAWKSDFAITGKN